MPEQIGRLFKGRIASQVVDIDAKVGKFAQFAIEVTNTGMCGDDVLKAVCGSRHREAPFKGGCRLHGPWISHRHYSSIEYEEVPFPR
jgi:hypothetical protein